MQSGVLAAPPKYFKGTSTEIKDKASGDSPEALSFISVLVPLKYFGGAAKFSGHRN